MKYPVMLVACCAVLTACGTSDKNDEQAYVPTTDRFAGSGRVDTLPTTEQRYNETADGQKFLGRNEINQATGSIAYDATTETLTISGDPFDLAGDFIRVPERDVRGFAAFENESGARNYTALVRTDTVHQLAAGVVGTPFKFDNEFGGTVLARGAVPNLPNNREVRHVGDYAALRNVGGNDGADMSNSFLERVEGQVQLDLDFFDDRASPGIEGVITNRRNMDGTTTREVQVEVPVKGTLTGETQTETRTVTSEVTYDDIVLKFTDIDNQGNFTGEAAVNGSSVGLYDGMIAGPDAAASAGIVVIREGGELERGAFTARAQE